MLKLDPDTSRPTLENVPTWENWATLEIMPSFENGQIALKMV